MSALIYSITFRYKSIADGNREIGAVVNRIIDDEFKIIIATLSPKVLAVCHIKTTAIS